MTARIGNVVIIAPEKEQQCDGCGNIDELRPYGEGGKKICYDCGMKNPRQTMRNMWILLWDEEPTEEDYKRMGY